MKVMKWSAIALAVSAGSTQFAVADAFVSDQAEAKGFIEDSSLNLLLRNYYFNRDGKEGRGDRVDWTQPRASSPPTNPASLKAPWASASMPSATWA